MIAEEAMQEWTGVKRGIRVLVIDDDEFVRTTLCVALTAAGLDVAQAPNGDQGLATLQSLDADVAIVDVFMPDKDGIEVIRDIRRYFPSLRVIAISGSHRSGGLDYLRVARSLGADVTLAKPFPPSDLVAAVIGLTRQIA
jgi:DNA-binding response OmpR family regulator